MDKRESPSLHLYDICIKERKTSKRKKKKIQLHISFVTEKSLNQIIRKS